MKLKDNDNLLFITKEQCYPDFLERLLNDKDNIYEIASNNRETIDMIRANRLKSFPIRKRE